MAAAWVVAGVVSVVVVHFSNSTQSRSRGDGPVIFWWRWLGAIDCFKPSLRLGGSGSFYAPDSCRFVRNPLDIGTVP